MNYPILIVPSETGGFRASLGMPFNVTVEDSTPAGVEAKASQAIVETLKSGGELRWLAIPPVLSRPPRTKDPLDEEMEKEVRDAIEEYQRECDESERRRIDDEDAEKARTAS